MDRTVAATCPKCSTTLRIPIQWADKAVKCKKCGAVVRAKGPKPVATPAAPAAPVVAHPSANGTPPAAVPAPLPPLNAPPPVMVFDPSTGTYVPAPASAIPGYTYSPAPAHGYPYPAYPPPGYPLYPAPASPPKNDFATMDEPRERSRKKYKKGGSGIVFVVFGVGLLLLVGGALGAAVLFKDKLTAMLNGGGTTPATTPPSDPDKNGNTANNTPAGVKTGSAPRRMLAMSVTKYLYCNPLTGGKSRAGTSEFFEAVKGLAFRWEVPDGKDNNQLFVLTDADGKLPAAAGFRPMLKPVITDTVAQFCSTCRPQDRVVIYFGGHAVAKNGKAYLVPTEGDLGEPDTLIPLEDFWARLRTCPAQQKVVLFDVCRLSTDDNAVRPGSEPMTAELEKLLHTPPDGVQVVTSCSAEQTAAEFRTAPDADTPQGSAFLGALRLAARKNKGPAVKPTDPLPVSQWVDGAAVRLNDLLGKEHPCKPKASGGEGQAVAANADEPPARRFDFPPAPRGADAKDVKAVFALLDTPPLLGPRSATDDPLDALVLFSEEVMKQYKPDVGVDEVEAEAKPLPPRIGDITPDQWKALKHPTRVAAVKALQEVRQKWAEIADPKADSVLFDGLNGKANDELKKKIERQQKPIANLSLDLGDTVDKLEELKADADKDESKFWKATFRYALAQAKLRLAFSHEANLALGNVRTDNLPDGVERGVRLVQVPKMKNKKESAGAKDAQGLLDELAKECKGTPWEVSAKQWRGVSLGLEWRAKKADADTTEK